MERKKKNVGNKNRVESDILYLFVTSNVFLSDQIFNNLIFFMILYYTTNYKKIIIFVKYLFSFLNTFL